MCRRAKGRAGGLARGFATVEVLVAVAIVVLIGTLAVLAFGGTDRARITAEAAEVALFLQEARMRVLESGQPMEIVLSAQDGVLTAGSARHSFSRGIAVSPDAARTILHPSGESAGLDLLLTRDAAAARVSLDWLTGRVAVQ